jgi:hypothetical protein
MVKAPEDITGLGMIDQVARRMICVCGRAAQTCMWRVEEITSPIVAACFVDVAVAEVDPKSASAVLKAMTEELPLSAYGLAHLKRVRKPPLPPREHAAEGSAATAPTTAASTLQVLLCTHNAWSDPETQERVAKRCGGLFKAISIAQVHRTYAYATYSSRAHAQAPSHEPATREQFEQWNRLWPCTFRPG